MVYYYSEVPNRRADRNKRAGLEKSATLLAYLLSKLINEQGGIFRLLHEKLRAGWKENLKNLSEHALLLGTSEYVVVHLFTSWLVWERNQAYCACYSAQTANKLVLTGSAKRLLS